MKRKHTLRVLGSLAAVLTAVGCGSPPSDDLGEVKSAETTENALTANALTANALTANALTANALTANALTANALTANALTANGLRDPLARMFLKYAVGCALPADQTITVTVDGATYSFPGQLGLAPDWGDQHGSCDGECQRWVSACMLARVDAAGVEREISVRGDNKALHPAPGEIRDYSVREGAYFGNLFIKGQPRFLCVAPGNTQDTRVCGDSLANCPMTVVGSCDDACDNGAFRSFADCQTKTNGGVTYHESITVFLPK
ncbi:MAG TPA: hypothetical protein VMU50_17210 [Polyangia bacterium]|nr:hypothetical protein [Polyangia bacterium]